ncbi:MAG: hypothetical protein IT561_14270, partial [Alphaproteobacteria bacterium]|nr:hypothetical protein [Alphaproteobacteria bacterium]
LTPLYLYYTEPAQTPAAPPPADEDCLTCTQARRVQAPRHAVGPLAPDLHRAGFAQAERTRAVAAAMPLTVPAAMAILAGPLAARP